MEVKCFPSEGKKDIITVYIDGEPWKEIHRSIFDNQIDIAIDGSTPSDLAAQFVEIEYTQAKKFVVRRLAMKNYSSFELIKALEERLVSEEAIDKIIEEFTTLGYINDNDWIEGFIRRQQQRNHSPQHIAMKLRAKAVPEEQIQSFLGKMDSSDSQLQRVLKLLRGRFRSKDLSNYKEKQKVFAALARKGFDFEIIKEAISLALEGD